VIEPFKDIEDARALAQAIVDTVREPLLVLDGDLEKIIPERAAMDGFEVEHEFPTIGRRIMLLNAARCSTRTTLKRPFF
jgi:hypothetical protein